MSAWMIRLSNEELPLCEHMGWRVRGGMLAVSGAVPERLRRGTVARGVVGWARLQTAMAGYHLGRGDEHRAALWSRSGNVPRELTLTAPVLGTEIRVPAWMWSGRLAEAMGGDVDAVEATERRGRPVSDREGIRRVAQLLASLAGHVQLPGVALGFLALVSATCGCHPSRTRVDDDSLQELVEALRGLLRHRVR